MSKKKNRAGIKTFTTDTIADKPIEELNEMNLDLNATEEGVELVRSFPIKLGKKPS